MKLSLISISNLETVLSTCAVAGIDTIIIEDGAIRGINDDKSCIIISDKNVPELPENTKLGLSRLGNLSSRLSLFRADPQLAVDAKENDRGEISTLEISSPSGKVQFRATSSALIKAPKKVNDVEKYVVTIGKDSVPFILQGSKAMGAKNVVIASKKDGVYIECTDTNQDVFSTRVAEPQADIFANTYKADVLLALLKAACVSETVNMSIGEVGTLSIEVNGHNLIILPQVQG